MHADDTRNLEMACIILPRLRKYCRKLRILEKDLGDKVEKWSYVAELISGCEKVEDIV